jgi:alpha-beta hydrolase superfamily lysophospholipase
VPPTVTRARLAGTPALIEHPAGLTSGSVLVHHGATADKEAALGQFSALSDAGIEVIYLDAALHGERKPPDLDAWVARHGYRNYVWESVRRTCLEAGTVIDALHERAPGRPVAVIGTSMGGYTAHWLLANEPRVRAGALISTHNRWQDPAVSHEMATWLQAERPDRRAHRYPPKPAIVIHGASDDGVPTRLGLESHAVLTAAYEKAGCPERLALHLEPDTAHETTPNMARVAVEWLATQAWRQEL